MRNLKLYGLALAVALLTLPVAPPRAQQTQKATAAATTAGVPSASFTAARKDAEEITAAKMKEVLYYIASDEMAGRDTPSAGLDATAKYIADRLAKLKLKPAGDDGTYFQKIELRKTEFDRASTRAELSGRALTVGTDFFPAGLNGGEAEGPLVYAGHGWVVKSKNINAYEGLDVRDKIVVLAGSRPPGLSAADMRALPAGDWEDPISYARRNGAKGIVSVPTNYDRVIRGATNMSSRGSYRVARFMDEASEDAGATKSPAGPTPVMIYPAPSMLDAIFAGEQATGAEVLKKGKEGAPLKGFALSPEKRLRLAVSMKTEKAMTQNVVAVLEGKDKNLKKEYVAVGAHYDHVGVGRPDDKGDTIYNGADDDGSGTTGVLAMAEAFAKGKRPRRSVLFVWHAGEEKGLWGSEYFVKYPTVPLESIVAQLNIDMIGRSRAADDKRPANAMLSGPDEIYVIGSRMMSTELASWSEGVNTAYLNLKFNYHYDDPADTEKLFYRSDHYNYAKMGIPIIFYFDGIHEDYHRPSDSPDRIDYQKMEKVTRTIFILASEIANNPKRPAVDKQLPSDRLGR